MKNLDVIEFSSQIQDEQVIILDVRTAEEYAQGHIQSAVNIDIYSEFFLSDISNLARDKHYAIYCRSGQRSTQAASQMDEMGFFETTNLAGGILAWQEASKLIVT